MSNANAIGIFDSGLGGISVWLEIEKLLPNESLIYIADSKNCPYGEKSCEEIIELSVKATEFLLSKGCKLIVVACNTATTAAIRYLRSTYQVPFVGIEPAVKPAAAFSKVKKVGILATYGTLQSSFYQETRDRFAADVKIYSQAGFGLVEAVEKGEIKSDTTRKLLHTYIQPMLEEGIDTLVLGCTHYPFLIPLIQEIIAGRVEIINPAPAVARRTFSLINEHELGKAGGRLEHMFYTSGDQKLLLSFLESNKVKGVACGRYE